VAHLRSGEETAGNLTHDLAIDASGYGRPSPVAAGYPIGTGPTAWPVTWTVLAAVLALALVLAATDPGVRRIAVRVVRR
jgi:hypothetical protein